MRGRRAVDVCVRTIDCYKDFFFGSSSRFHGRIAFDQLLTISNAMYFRRFEQSPDSTSIFICAQYFEPVHHHDEREDSAR